MGRNQEFQSTGEQGREATGALRLTLLLLGFTAVIAQVVLMRELLVVFYGNELALGVMLASWLLWTAIGAGLLGRWAMRSQHPRKLVAGLQALLAFALPFTLLAVRASKGFCQTVPGEILGPVPMFLTSCGTLSVFCVLSGGLFAAGSRLFAEVAGASLAAATGAAYLLEAAGSGVGGVLAGLALVRLANPFWIMALLGVLNLLAAWMLVAPLTGRRRALAAGFAAMAALVVIASYALQPLSLARLWRGFHLVATQNSFYGSLAVVDTGGSRSLFENGLIVMTVPDPSAAEEAVHFALLEHPDPRRVLLIGGGVNGSLAQALAHPSVERLDYVELDPMIFEIAARYFPGIVDKGRLPAIARTHAVDGRRFLKSTSDIFDVIIVNLPDPHTAQLNRFYTEEFYREAAAKLRPGGILSFQVTSSENYISQELADFLRCLNRTLQQVFPEVVAIPGETVHFFAAKKSGTLTTDPQELVRRLRARGLHTQYVREYFLPFRMSRDRMQDLQLQIEPLPSTPVNHDFAPVAYYFDVALWSAPFHPASARWIEALARMSFTRILLATMLVLSALVPLLWLWPAKERGGERGMGVPPVNAATRMRIPPEAGGVEDGTGTRPVKAATRIWRWLAGSGDKSVARARRSAAFAVAAVGFTELGLEILLLLGFQALYGYVYHELTILVALFMVGVALGGWWALRRAATENVTPPSWRPLSRLEAGGAPQIGTSPASRGSASGRSDLRLLVVLQIILAAAPLLLYGLLIQLGHVSSAGGQRAASEIAFPALALLAGLLGGFQFLLASRVYFAEPQLPAGAPGPSSTPPYNAVRAHHGVPLQIHSGEPGIQVPQRLGSPGVLYALDLAGACAGALALSILLIPVYGFFQTAALMAAVNLAPAVMAAASSRVQA
jgi:spermidine synthase